jgi:hypothetical protein
VSAHGSAQRLTSARTRRTAPRPAGDTWALGGQAKVLELPMNRLATAAMLVVLVIGGTLAAAPAWRPFFLSDEVASFTAPILGVVVAVPAFAALCLLVETASNGFSVPANARNAGVLRHGDTLPHGATQIRPAAQRQIVGRQHGIK